MLRLKEIPKFWKQCLFARNFGISFMTPWNIKFRFLPNSDQISSSLGWKLYTKTLFLRKVILDKFVHAKSWLIPCTFILKPDFKFWHRVMTAIWELTLPNFNEKLFLCKDSMIICYLSPLINLPIIIGSWLLVWLNK